MKRKPYPSDLTDEQWAILEPLIPAVKAAGHPRNVNMQEVINAIFYILCGGMHLANDATRVPGLEDGLPLFSALAARRGVAADESTVTGKGASPGGKEIDS